MWLLDWLRVLGQLLRVVVLTRVGRNRLLAPEGQDLLRGLLQALHPHPDGLPFAEAVRLVLPLMPASPDAQDRAAVADHVERGGHLGRQRRVAIRDADDELPEANPFRDRCDGA